MPPRRSSLQRFLFVAFALAATICGCSAPAPPSGAPVDTERLAALSGDWIDGYGAYSLRLGPDGAANLSYWSGSMGASWYRRGRIRQEGARLIFDPEEVFYDWEWKSRPGLEDFIFTEVRVGARSILVPEYAWPMLVNRLKNGRRWQYCAEEWLSRLGEHVLSTDESPVLPEPWNSRVVAPRLRGRVVEVQPDGNAIVDLGWKQGIWEGLDLFVAGKDPARPCPVTVVTVGRKTAVVANRMGGWSFTVGMSVDSNPPLEEEENPFGDR